MQSKTRLMVHPRACGGTGLRLVHSNRGPSPRVRGGKRCLTDIEGIRPVHPRACGGNSFWQLPASCRNRSRSIPARAGGNSMNGSIPARAGETRAFAIASTGIRRFNTGPSPRVRGKLECGTAHAVNGSPSSMVHPRACGGNVFRPTSSALVGELGSIPARAGETRILCAEISSTLTRGPSPRVRGKPMAETLYADGPSSGVHPRACGGNASLA